MQQVCLGPKRRLPELIMNIYSIYPVSEINYFKKIFEWIIPKKLPKKDDTLWVQKGKEAVKVKVARVADKGNNNMFLVMEEGKNSDPLVVDPIKSLWQYQKPVSSESPDSSAIQGSSTPEASGGAVRKTSFMEKLKK